MWKILPAGARKYENKYFKVISNGNNSGKLGQIATIDKAYSLVTTKYIYHL